MIFYFSGTGNSLHAAKSIAQAQGEKLIFIASEMDKEPAQRVYMPSEEELIGFVYPIYAWGPPQIVLNFIKTIKINCKKSYVFSVSTCGATEGKATKRLQKVLLSKGLTLDSAFSLIMPGNYTIGEDMCSEDEAAAILENADKQINEINATIKNRLTGVFQLIPGVNPFFHTAVINPLFNRFARNTKKFHVTDACTHCGLCEKICPVHTITLKEKPVWGKACTQCLGCINRCPAHAIQYGDTTQKRGRYVHPNMKAR